MKKHIHSNQFCTISFSKRFLIHITLATLLSSCGAVIQAPVPTQPNTESTQTEHTPATQELTLVPPTEVATEVSIITFTTEPVLTNSEVFSLIPELEGITHSFSVDEKTYQEFLDKKIPFHEDLRVGEDNLVKEIGEYEIETHEGYGTVAHVQLLMMGGFINKEGLHLIVGTQDVNGNRIILPIQMTFGNTGSISNTMMIIDGNEVKKIILPAVALNNLSGEECLKYAKQNIGEVVVIQLLLDVKKTGQPRPEFIEADQKYSISERLEINNIFCKNPEDLIINDFKFENIPWGQLIVFSN